MSKMLMRMGEESLCSFFLISRVGFSSSLSLSLSLSLSVCVCVCVCVCVRVSFAGTSNRMSLPSFGYQQMQRVCDSCYQKHRPDRNVGFVDNDFVVLNPDTM